MAFDCTLPRIYPYLSVWLLLSTQVAAFQRRMGPNSLQGQREPLFRGNTQFKLDFVEAAAPGLF